MRRTLIVAALAAASLSVTASASFATDRASTNVRTGNRPTCGARGSLQVVGLTADQRLTCFRANSPGRARTIGIVSNLQTDTRLVGIDYRPADGNLYGVGNQGGIYTVDPATASASLVSRINVAGVPLALSGVSFGVDFNPAADRLRIVSDTGQNLRVNVDDGATNNDGFLNYMAGTPTTGIGGAAYVEQRRRPEHEHDAVRLRRRSRSDCDPVAAEQRLARCDREVRCRQRTRDRRRHLQPGEERHDRREQRRSQH